MLIVIGSARTTPATATEMVEIAMAHSQRSRLEPGCIAHNVHVDCEDPSRLVFVEKWADIDALKAHFAVPESLAFVKAIRALSPEPTVMQMFDAAAIRPAR
jgi:quinol monooxygenase YgiN